MQLNLRQLRYFAAVVETGGFSRAATRLRVAQPGLSLQVANLERALGVMLLVRTPFGVKPTEQGARLYRRASRIVTELDRVAEDLQDDVGLAGEVTLGVATEASAALAARIAGAMLARHPELRLRISEAPSAVLEGRLREGSLALALLYPGKGRDSVDGRTDRQDDGAEWRPLFQQRLFHVSADREGGGEGPAISLASLASRSLVLPPWPSTLRDRLDAAMEDAGLRPIVVGEAETSGTLLALVRAGHGDTVLPLVGPTTPDLRWSPIAEPALSQTALLCSSTILVDRRVAASLERLVTETVEQTRHDIEPAGREVPRGYTRFL